MVSLHCDDDDDFVINNNDITGGRWLIGDPANEGGGVATVDPAGDLWPHQIRSWQYQNSIDEWESDPQLTVTGNININILYLNIDV